MINARHAIAWENPCVVAEQCFDSQFMQDIRYAGFNLSTVLTLNFGME